MKLKVSFIANSIKNTIYIEICFKFNERCARSLHETPQNIAEKNERRPKNMEK